MSNDTEVGVFEALLSDFRRQVPERPERRPTLLEITRFPHYENVCSNILAFYLDPGKPHGLGTLFLEALGKVGNIKDLEGSMGSDVEVETQERTASGNYIDILIRSPSHAVLIENKIFHAPNNPFCDYAKHLASLKQPCKHKLLLTLKPIEERTERDIESYGFRHITHGELVNGIRKLLGDHILDADTRYLTFLLDFLNTLENLKEDMIMNERFIDFLKKQRPCEVEWFLRNVAEFKKDLSKKIRDLEQKCPVEPYCNVRATAADPPKDGLFHVLAHDIQHSSFDNNVVVETVIHSGGWKIQIWLRNVPRGGPPNKGPVDGRQEELRSYLNIEGIPLEDDTGVGHGPGTRFLLRSFEYTTDLDVVAEAVRQTLHRLATSDRRAA